jgi:glycosyltransferase involved in cell wall biosynthesis
MFKDFVPYHEIPRYIAASNVGMIPYKPNYNLNCVLTLKLLEYLSMGNPVVSTNLESISDIFSAYPFVRISKDTNEFSNNLLELVEMEKSPDAVTLIRESYSWDVVTARICKKVEELASPIL